MRVSELFTESRMKFRFDPKKHYGVVLFQDGSVEIALPPKGSWNDAVDNAEQRYPKSKYGITTYDAVTGDKLNKVNDFKKLFDERGHLAEGFGGPIIKNPKFENGLIHLTIGDKDYEYTVNQGLDANAIWNSFKGVLKHSTGNALKFLKKNAEGKRIEA